LIGIGGKDKGKGGKKRLRPNAFHLVSLSNISSAFGLILPNQTFINGCTFFLLLALPFPSLPPRSEKPNPNLLMGNHGHFSRIEPTTN
jgi:hypothetical protein